MSDPGIETLPVFRTPSQARRDRNLRRVGLGLLTLFVLAGLLGLLGVRSGTVTDVGDGVELRVEHPTLVRPGLDAPFTVEVHAPDGFTEPVHLAVSRDLFELFDYHNHYPNPMRESADDESVVYVFDRPPGEVLSWSLDAHVHSGEMPSADEYWVQVRDPADRVLAEVSFRTWVLL